MMQFRDPHPTVLVSRSGDRIHLALSGEGGAGVELRLTLAQAEVLLAVLEACSRAASSGVQVAMLSKKTRQEIEDALRLTLIALKQRS